MWESPTDQCFCVMGMLGNYFLHLAGLQMYLHLVRVLEDNYPEALKKLFIVNGESLE